MKREFDWDRFLDKNNNICVICGTKKSAIDFFKQKTNIQNNRTVIAYM